MKKLLLVFLLLLTNQIFAQKIDTILNMGCYKSYYSFKIKAPLLVVYDLYKGGGSCSRTGENFIGGDLASLVANSHDYASAKDSLNRSVYDKGHLLSWEDVAFDCEKAQNTFYFWNCYPQTPALNRGSWKKLENDVRNSSQTEHLLVLVGGFYNDVEIGNNVHVPYECWKIVYSYDRKKVIISEVFTNTKTPIQKSVKWKEINKFLIKMDKNLDIKKYFN